MKISSFIILLLLGIGDVSTAQQWTWARGVTGTTIASAVCTDQAGNVYVAGTFDGTPVWSGGDSLVDPFGAYQQVFIAKYDASGNVVWLRNASGQSDVAGITIDAFGMPCIVGNFYGDSISFGSHVLSYPNPGGQSKMYFTKYDASGNVIWAKNLGGINIDVAAGLSADHFGNIYVAGNFSSDSLTFGSVTAHHMGAEDCFIAKFNVSGDALWIRTIGTPYLDGSSALCTDAAGDVFLTGYTSTPYMFLGSLTRTVISPYDNNVFISKYDSSGNNLWFRYAGGDQPMASSGLSADAAGNVYITGYFYDSITFGNSTLVNHGNVFTARYDTAGSLVWVQEFGNFSEQSNGLIADDSGSTYITGFFYTDTLNFGSSRLINPIGNQRTFVIKYDKAGHPLQAAEAEGRSQNIGTGIAYHNGSVYVIGSFVSASIVFLHDTLPAIEQGMFLARLDSLNDIASGIEPGPQADNLISVYPNPSSGMFYFSILPEGTVIEVYDMLGQMITQKREEGNSTNQINLSGYRTGLYTYRITAQGNILKQGKMILD